MVMATSKAGASVNVATVVTRAQQLKALSDVLTAVRQKRFEIDQSDVNLNDAQRLELSRDYDVARDAYYKGAAAFMDSTDSHVTDLLADIGNAAASLDAIQVSQDKAVQALGAIAALVGLVAKLVVLGTA
jgi:hypothetical protein